MSSVPPKWTPNYKQASQFEARRLAEMVDQLPAVILDMDNSELIRQAALECFFVHVRTPIEFLGIRPPDPRDRSARDTFTNTNWPPTFDAALRARLDADWEMVSQHLVHFSRPVLLMKQAASSCRAPTAVPWKGSPTMCSKSGPIRSSEQYLARAAPG